MSEATFCSRASLGVVQESEDDRRNKQAGQDLQAGFQSTKSSALRFSLALNAQHSNIFQPKRQMGLPAMHQKINKALE